MLKNSCRQVLQLFLYNFAGLRGIPDIDLLWSSHLSVNSRKTETALIHLNLIAAEGDNLGVDNLADLIAGIHHEKSAGNPYLRCGKPDPPCVAHERHHFVEQFHKLRRYLNRLCGLSQNLIPVYSYLHCIVFDAVTD